MKKVTKKVKVMVMQNAGDKPEGKGQTGENVVLHGFLLAALFRTQPELAEMVYLEMREMIPNGELTL